MWNWNTFCHEDWTSFKGDSFDCQMHEPVHRLPTKGNFSHFWTSWKSIFVNKASIYNQIIGKIPGIYSNFWWVLSRQDFLSLKLFFSSASSDQLIFSWIRCNLDIHRNRWLIYFIVLGLRAMHAGLEHVNRAGYRIAVESRVVTIIISRIATVFSTLGGWKLACFFPSNS